VTVFTMVMLMTMGSILSVLDANKKSQTLRAVMDNLNFTLDGVTRGIRFGSNYHCGSGNNSLPADCVGGDSSFTLKSAAGPLVTYRLNGGRISRAISNGTEYFLTSPDVTIQNLTFRVIGSQPYSNGSDLYQPEVIITISGYAGVKPSAKSTFTLQTTVSQRALDFQ
jgi:hypothetical protein